MDLISVIVAVYKSEAYLDKCIQSLVDQTYTNIEIILVDDGSPDSSGKICDLWAEKDFRIRVIHKENGGAAQARNVGVAAATGKYIAFVDGDDWVEPTMYERMLNALSSTGAQIAACGYEKFSVSQKAISYEGTPSFTAYSTEEALTLLIKDQMIHQLLWNKVYPAALVKALPIPEDKLNEDEFWTYRIIGDVNRVVYVDAPLYHYLQHEGSIMHTYSVKRLTCLEAYEERASYVEQRYPNLTALAVEFYLFACLYHYQILCRESHLDQDGIYRKSIIKRFRAIDRTRCKEGFSLKKSVWYMMFSYMPSLTAWVRNTLKIGI